LEQIADADSDASLSSLMWLFESVKSTEVPAFRVLAKRGTKILLRIVDDGLRAAASHGADDVLLAL
jgi:hypothetical protein